MLWNFRLQRNTQRKRNHPKFQTTAQFFRHGQQLCHQPGSQILRVVLEKNKEVLCNHPEKICSTWVALFVLDRSITNHSQCNFACLLGGLCDMARNRKAAVEKEVLDITDLCPEWDSQDDIRTRLRDGGPIIHPETKESDDVQSCCRNSSLLVPILIRMSTLGSRPLPPLNPLRAEIEALMLKNKRGNAPEEVSSILKASWRIKKLCGFVKMKVRRGEVSTVSCFLIWQPFPEKPSLHCVMF